MTLCTYLLILVCQPSFRLVRMVHPLFPSNYLTFAAGTQASSPRTSENSATIPLLSHRKSILPTFAPILTPFFSKQIESNLLGAIFDPYVRWIVWEGIRQWWRDDLESWLACPADGDPYPHSSIAKIPASAPAIMHHLKSASSFVLALLPPALSTLVTLALPIPLKETENFHGQSLALTPGALAMKGENMTFPACAYTWAVPLHEINCALAWPAEYTGEHGMPLIELDTEQYIGRIKREKTIEKLLAMAGLRLAKVVNEALAETGEGSLFLGF